MAGSVASNSGFYRPFLGGVAYLREKGLMMSSKALTGFTIILMAVSIIHSHAFAKDCLSEAISVESVLGALNSRADRILIDVRNSKEFEKFRIPGSLNIPLFAVKTKTFLKSNALVLMNEGQSYKELIHECAILSGSGFTVSILDGGLSQWRRRGGPLEGDVFAQRELNRVTPQTFFAGQGHENWIVIDLSRSGKPGIRSEKIQPVHIPYANDPEDFISKVKDVVRQQKDKDFSSILIYDEAGIVYDEIERHIQAAGIQNVLYLKGGLEGYKTFEQQQIHRLVQGKQDPGTRDRRVCLQ